MNQVLGQKYPVLHTTEYNIPPQLVEQITREAKKQYAQQLGKVVSALQEEIVLLDSEAPKEVAPIRRIRIEEMDNWYHMYLDGELYDEGHYWKSALYALLEKEFNIQVTII